MFIYLLLALNVITFIVYGIDKLKVRKGWWRRECKRYSTGFHGFDTNWEDSIP